MANELTTRPQETFTLTPRNFAEAMELAKLLANSDLVPKDYKGKPGNVVVASAMGAELGLSPMQAIQNISVINGRPSLWGDAMLALCQRHKSTEDICEMSDGDVAALRGAIERAANGGPKVPVTPLQLACLDVAATLAAPYSVIGAKRRGRPTPVIKSFTWEDAQRAGLVGKAGPWTQYPARMIQMRARAFCLRDAYADVLRGLHSAEEVSDYADTPTQYVDATASMISRPAAAATDSEPVMSAEVDAMLVSIAEAEKVAELEALLPDIKAVTGDVAPLRRAYKERIMLLRSREQAEAKEDAEQAETSDDRPWDKYATNAQREPGQDG